MFYALAICIWHIFFFILRSLEGTPRKYRVGVCGQLPKSLTLFKDKVVDISYLAKIYLKSIL